MNYMADDADYIKLMQLPYIFDELNVEDISARLEYFKPENMFIGYWSPKFQKELENNPAEFKKEYYYSKHFSVQMISDEEAKVLMEASVESVYPNRNPDEIKLGNAPPNKFMPSPDKIKSMKVDRPENGKAALPIKHSSDNWCLWFKQDDTFDQPLVKAACFIYTRDCGYPDTLKSILLAKLWKKCLK
jgi:hypothetical protein